MVFHDHDVSNFEVLIQATGGVGQNHCVDAEQLKDSNRQRDLKETKTEAGI